MYSSNIHFANLLRETVQGVLRYLVKNNQNPLCTCLIIILTIRVRKLEKTFIGRLLNMNMKLLYYSLSHVTYEIVQEIATLARTPVAIKTPFLFLLPLQFRKVILSLSHTKYICLLCHSQSSTWNYLL